VPRIEPTPDHYTLICARQYAATMRKLKTAIREDERRGHMKLLHYLMDAGISEADLERRAREVRLPIDLRDYIKKSQPLPVNRILSREEVELIRQASSVLPIATLDSLSAHQMLDLADMYEGWAQDSRINGIDMARLLGWADGFRELAAVAGVDYEPAAMVPGEPDTLLQFLAKKMKCDQAL
jgi:hypothetical protein